MSTFLLSDMPILKRLGPVLNKLFRNHISFFKSKMFSTSLGHLRFGKSKPLNVEASYMARTVQ